MPRTLIGLMVLCLAPQTPRPLVTSVTAAGATLSLESSTFMDVSARFGPWGQITHRGDAAEAEASVCYRLSAAGSTGRLAFLSGEVGGLEFVSGFRVSLAPADTSCGRLAIAPAAVRTERGLHLGQSRQQMADLLGGHGRDSADVVVWTRLTGPRKATVSTVIVRFEHGRATMLEGWLVTTN